MFSMVGFIIFNLFGTLYTKFSENNPPPVASIQINKTVGEPNPLTGETFVYTIQYRCASLTDDCLGTLITDPLPPEVEYVGLAGSIHTTSETYDPITHTVTFTLVSPLTAGTTGQVQVQVRFPNGYTPNGTVAANTATISASNAPSDNSTVNATASASPKPNLEKQFVNGGSINGNTTYQMMFCNNQGATNQNGTLTLYNLEVRDTLPAGSVYVQHNTNWRVTTTYDPVDHVIVFTRDSLAPGECMWPKVTIRYPDPPFSIGSNVTNKGYFSYTAAGEPTVTEESEVSYVLTAPNYYATTYKSNSHGSNFKGSGGTYYIYGGVEGTEDANDFCVNDTFPDGIEVTGFDVGGWYYGGITGIEDRIDVYYTTNLNGPTLVPGSPFSIWYPNTFIMLSDLGLTAGGAEYITSLNWCFGDVPAGFATYEEIEILYNIKPDAPTGIATNCATITTSSPGFTLNINCNDLDILADNPGVNLNPIKGTAYSGPFNKGDIIDFQLVPRNELGSADSLENPIVYELLPEGLTYVPGSWYLPAWGNLPGYPNPTFTHIIDYKGTGREFLRWEWSGANSIKIPSGERVAIQFQAVITDEALGGFPAFYNYFYVETSSPLVNCWGNGARIDSFDFDDDSDYLEVLCGGRHAVNINEIVILESEKLVKGQLDTSWTKYPETGYTVPGGLADYQLIVRNKGNIQIDSVIVIDILPFVGDEGVINLDARNSRWRPNLVGQVIAPPGVTVYYSTEENPCRSAEGILPSGPPSCTAANWTAVPPSDITTVQSLKFDFGSNVLNPNDSLVLEWPMRAPVNALTTIGAQPDSTAWNSFGFIGQRVDNGNYLLPSEPVKVGISMNNSVPAVIGDWVWVDANNNGIQNGGELGYDGMRVELYEDNGDGISDPYVDTYVNFTVTADGGFYLFPYLPSGNYFLVFYKPAPYGVTTLNAGGNDALDSDGTLTNYNGFTVAITPVTNLSGTEYDLDWDLGIYPNGLAAVGNYVWADTNSDGIQNEPNSNGLNGVTVNLYNNSNPGTILATTVTSNDINGNPGYYLFDQLNPGDYFVEFVLPASTTFSPLGSSGSSDPLDSDANTSTGRTEVFALATNVYDETWDAGLIVSGTEDCTNGIDDDGDGLVDHLDPDCIDLNACCDGTNLILNGSFENGSFATNASVVDPNNAMVDASFGGLPLDDFDADGGIYWIEDPTRATDGDRFLYLPEANDKGKCVYQREALFGGDLTACASYQITFDIAGFDENGTEANTNYVIEFFYKNDDGSLEQEMVQDEFIFECTSASAPNPIPTSNWNNLNWMRVSGTIDLPPPNNSAYTRIEILISISDGGGALLDNVCVNKVSENISITAQGTDPDCSNDGLIQITSVSAGDRYEFNTTGFDDLPLTYASATNSITGFPQTVVNNIPPSNPTTTYYLRVYESGDCFKDTSIVISNFPCAEVCGDGIDNDGNGFIDDGCEICDDGIDNDGDGLVDCEDPDCTPNLLTNGGFEDTSAIAFSTTFEGSPAALLPKSSTAVPGWFMDYSCPSLPAPCPDSYLIDDTADNVNNPEGDYFLWLAQGGYCGRQSLGLELGVCYEITMDVAAWSSPGPQDTTTFAVEALGGGIDNGPGIPVELFRAGIPASTSWSNLNWQSLSFNWTGPINGSTNLFFSQISTGVVPTGLVIDNIQVREICCEAEICNDGVDNDGDGDIDFQDADCDCPDVYPNPIDFDFSNASALTGTGLNLGDQILYSNVGDIDGQSVDIVATVANLVNLTTLEEHGYAGSGDNAIVELPSMRETIGTEYYADIQYELFESGTSTPINGSYEIEIADIDSISTARVEIIGASQNELDYYELNNPSNIQIQSANNYLTGTGTANESASNPEGTIKYVFVDKNAFMLRYGMRQHLTTSTGRAAFIIDGNNFNNLGECITGEICDDGIDNDADGLTDCDDPDCSFPTTLSPDETICIGTNTVLSVGGGDTYLWSTSETDSVILISSLMATTEYFVTITNAIGCSVIDSITVTIENCSEVCFNGIDDDGDGNIDEDDADCEIDCRGVVAVDFATAKAEGSGASGIPTLNYTPPTGNDRYLIFMASLERDHLPLATGDNWGNDTYSSPVISFGGVNLTSIGSQKYFTGSSSFDKSFAELSVENYFYFLPESSIPASGTFNIVSGLDAPLTDGDEMIFSVGVFVNVDTIESHYTYSNSTSVAIDMTTINGQTPGSLESDNMLLAFTTMMTNTSVSPGAAWTEIGENIIINRDGNFASDTDRSVPIYSEDDGLSQHWQALTGVSGSQTATYIYTGGESPANRTIRAIRLVSTGCDEVCGNEEDDDLDGFTDCDDPDCGPSANDATLTTCDNTNGSGTGTFFLPGASNDISGGISGLSVSFYLNLTDAQNKVNALANSFISPDGQLYARLEVDSSGCFDTAVLTLSVSGTCIEDCSDGIDNDGDGLIDCFDCDECGAFAGCGDNDGDGIGDFCDLDDDNDGIPDAVECPDYLYGPELIINGDFEDAYANWTSDFNRGWNNYLPTSGGCPQQGWVAISACSSINGSCPDYYNYYGSTPDGSVVITDPYGTGANVIATTNCNVSSGVCLAETLPDHTSGTGFSLYVDPNTIAGEAYWKQLVTVEANKEYEFSAWIMVIEEDPNLQFRINGATLTPGFNLDRQTGGSDGPDVWQQFFANWYSGTTSGDVLVELVNLTAGCVGNDIRLDDVSLKEVITDCDCDGDGVDNHLDLDSDNDGLYDLHEAGHLASDANADGIIDNANLNSGNNGLFDALETVAESGIINYVPGDSETTPDGILDICELDSDGDGCLDVEEEDIADSDTDGIAGTGVPSVNPANGLITSITYAAPPNNIWQNPLIGPCLSENCLDGLDNDFDGNTDCDDPDCITNPTINLSQNTACVNETITISSSDIGVGTTYNWNFGTNASPTTASGIGPHNVSFTSCGSKTISLTVQKNGCTIIVDSIVQIIDNTDPVWDTNPQDLILECNSSKNLNDSISLWLASNGYGIASDNCSSFKITNNYTGLTADCGSTASITVDFIAIDSCGNSAIGTANIQILDTQAPAITSVNDITVDCDDIPAPPSPTATDSCDVSPDLTYQEVRVQHPDANWNSIGSCSLLYEVTSGVYDDKGTPSTADDEMSFVLTVIGQNTGTGWSANIEGNAYTSNYYTSLSIGPFLSNGPSINFTLIDAVDPACLLNVTVNSSSF